MQKIKVRVLVGIVGVADENYDQPDFGYNAGEIVELHPKLAEAWFKSGFAERFVEGPEAAVMPKVETATQPEAATKGRKVNA